MFLTLFILGREHPKKSFDVFLQPLIQELKDLWNVGVQAYDISVKQNFTLKVVLLWTISDFPAYSMLSDWSTHGRLSCPYCMEDIGSFQLKHGRKPCWFDCHRCFISIEHPWRRNKMSFTRNRSISSMLPIIPTGEQVFYERIM